LSQTQFSLNVGGESRDRKIEGEFGFRRFDDLGRFICLESWDMGGIQFRLSLGVGGGSRDRKIRWIRVRSVDK